MTKFEISEELIALCKSEKEKGKHELTNLLNNAISCFSPSNFDVSNIPELKSFMYNLFTEVIKQKIEVPLVVGVLDCIKGKPEYIEIVIDILWLLGIEIESNESKELRHMSEEWKTYGKLVLDLNGNDICSIEELSSRLEMSEIEISGIQKDYKSFEKKLIRINTRLYYTQNKYNLLREENEGFSKLITELYVVLNDKNVNEILSHIQSLIGYFDLDPHRVCDIILTCFESQLQYYNSYIQILSNLEREYIPHILGFKFRQHVPTDPSNTRTPDSLSLVTAYLIDNDIITIGDIYNHLYPEEKDLANMFNSRKMYVEQYNKSLKVITINGIQAPTNKNDCNIVDNQHIQLLCNLLRIGSWEDFMIYYKHLSSLEINILYDKQIIISLCNYLLYLISPIYENSISIQKKLNQDYKSYYTNKKIKVTSNKSLPRVNDFKELLNTLDTVLSVLRYMVITDITLFTYICRLLRYYINQESDYFQQNDNHQLLMKILSSYLVPSLSLVNYNPALSHELWTILDNFPFYQRYEIYSYWQYLNSTEPILEASCKTMENNATQKMKRLTKDNGGIIGRQISILTHSSPLSVFEVIFRQIESYDNLIGVVVDSARCYTYLSYDILFYYFLYQLSKDRSELKSDGENFEDWLCNVSRFIGLLANKYHFTDLTGIFEYISNTLIKGSIGELLILNSLIQEMGGVEIMNHNNITESQLLCSSGGMLLIGEKSFYNYNYRSEKISKKIRNTLMSNNLLTRLLIQLGIERSRVIYDYEDTSKKMLYSLLDTTHLSLSLLAYLCFRDSELYTSFTNSIEHPFVFKERYNMDMEVIFHLLRNKMKNCYLNNNNNNNIWYPYSDQFKELLKRCLKPEILDSITIELYITFWILSYPDVKVPREQYDKYIKELEDKIKDEKDIDEKKELKSTLEKVKEELVQQGKDYMAMDALLKKNKEIYLKDIVNHKESINIFIKYCIKPRILFSYDDAIYSATFVEKINTIGTPYFSTIQFYYKISDVLFPIIPKLSEREASNLGLFLCELWRKLNEWRSNKNTYTKECENNPGFCKKYRQLESEKYGYDEYIKIYSKMHKTQIESFLNYLKSDEYSNLRNSLIVLKKMIDVYPMIKSDYDNLILSIKSIINNKRFEDVTLFAKNYNAELLKNESRMINYKSKPTIHSNISNTPNTTPRDTNVIKKTIITPSLPPTSTTNNASSSNIEVKRENSKNMDELNRSEATKRKEAPSSNENIPSKKTKLSSNIKVKEEIKRENNNNNERERSHSRSSSHRNEDRRQSSSTRGIIRKEEGELNDYQNRNKRDYNNHNDNDYEEKRYGRRGSNRRR